jgi:UDP-N-acetylmuramoyl-tripeptide--D-alanyl-D-alanine ligase
VIPAGEPLLDPHRRDELRTVTFGPGGDVTLVAQDADGRVTVNADGERIELQLDFRQAHLRGNLLAAVAAARAIGVTPEGAVTVTFSGRRGERHLLANAITVIDDCYNANPMSMRAALDDLAATAAGRRVAVLGDMLELGPDSARFHAEIGAHARASGVELLVAVGPRSAATAEAYGAAASHAVADAAAAAALVPELLQPGDTVLVKASRGVGLEVVTEALAGAGTGEAPA